MKRLIVVAILMATPLSAQQASSDPSRPFVLDASTAFSDVDGDGTWRSYDAVLTWKRPRGTAYLFASHGARPSGSGTFAAAGLVHDWSSRLFTYTALGAGSGDAPYIARLRADAEVNFKFLPSRAVVASAGFTTIRYAESRRDDVTSAGLTWYGPVIITYRYFQNISHPGSIDSHSQMLQAGFEHRGERAVWLRHSWGSEAYLPAAIISPEAVHTRGRTTSLSYRQWLNRRGGFTAELDRQTKGDSFERSGARIGLFVQF